VNFNS